MCKYIFFHNKNLDLRSIQELLGHKSAKKIIDSLVFGIMIQKFYIKGYLNFQESELDLTNGLIVFIAPSGSGKFLLIESILASVGGASCDASISESSVTQEIDEEQSGIFNEEPNEKKEAGERNSFK